MIVTFANQKGGAGKSTLCVLFAHYLSDKGYDIHLIDMDFQKTLERMRSNEVSKSVQDIHNEDATFDNPQKFSVEYVNTDSIAPVLETVEKNKKSVYLFDAPGNIANKDIVLTLLRSDVIITPFQYDAVTLDSTGVFVQVLNSFRIPAKVFFIPNRIDAREKMSFASRTNELLERNGRKVTPIVYSRSEMKKISTLTISKLQYELVSPAFDVIYNAIFC